MQPKLKFQQTEVTGETTNWLTNIKKRIENNKQILTNKTQTNNETIKKNNTTTTQQTNKTREQNKPKITLELKKPKLILNNSKPITKANNNKPSTQTNTENKTPTTTRKVRTNNKQPWKKNNQPSIDGYITTNRTKTNNTVHREDKQLPIENNTTKLDNTKQLKPPDIYKPPDIDNPPPTVLAVKVKSTSVTDMKEFLAMKKVEREKQQAKARLSAASKRALQDDYRGETITKYFTKPNGKK